MGQGAGAAGDSSVQACAGPVWSGHSMHPWWSGQGGAGGLASTGLPLSAPRLQGALVLLHAVRAQVKVSC